MFPPPPDDDDAEALSDAHEHLSAALDALGPIADAIPRDAAPPQREAVHALLTHLTATAHALHRLSIARRATSPRLR